MDSQNKTGDEHKEGMLDQLYVLRAGMAYVFKRRKDVAEKRAKLTAYELSDRYYDLDRGSVDKQVYEHFKKIKEDENLLKNHEKNKIKESFLEVFMFCTACEFESLTKKEDEENRINLLKNYIRLTLFILFTILLIVSAVGFVCSFGYNNSANATAGTAVSIVGMLISLVVISVLLTVGIKKSLYEERKKEIGKELDSIKKRYLEVTGNIDEDLEKKRYDAIREKEELKNTVDKEEYETNTVGRAVLQTIREEFKSVLSSEEDWKKVDDLIIYMEDKNERSVSDALEIVNERKTVSQQKGILLNNLEKVTNNAEFISKLKGFCNKINSIIISSREESTEEKVKSVDHETMICYLKETSEIGAEELYGELSKIG